MMNIGRQDYSTVEFFVSPSVEKLTWGRTDPTACTACACTFCAQVMALCLASADITYPASAP